MFTHNPDIMCLQEVDRLEKILPALDSASYSYHYAAGPKKKHGCVIAFKKSAYAQVGDHLVHYDDEFVRDSGEDNARIGASFRTKNIGSIVALQETNRPGHGVVVATTHLFWHPRYTYERARQAGILKRAVLRFRSEKGLDHWPCIISGDFNFAPDDPAYALLVGDKLHPGHDDLIKLSHVVHSTIDPTVIPADSSAVTEEDGDESADADKRITSARCAVASDGLLSSLELQQFYESTGVPLRSAYDEGLRQISDFSSKPTTFGDRLNLAPSRLGAFEPQWTSYTHYWKTVLDYIFIIDPKDTTSSSVVSSVLEPHKTETIAKGLPQLGVCGSDHVSLCAEIIFPQQ
ncbi:Endonuclease/exonuclease/phosphatase [Mucidula mucida]|nr:Endonuclease/exonuclease/phosphatase [Mucidula mucida]